MAQRFSEISHSSRPKIFQDNPKILTLRNDFEQPNNLPHNNNNNNNKHPPIRNTAEFGFDKQRNAKNENDTDFDYDYTYGKAGYGYPQFYNRDYDPAAKTGETHNNKFEEVDRRSRFERKDTPQFNTSDSTSVIMNNNKPIRNVYPDNVEEERFYERDNKEYQNYSYDQDEDDEQLNYEDILYRGDEDGEEYKVDYDDEEGEKAYDDRDRPQIPQRSLSPHISEDRLRKINLDSLRQSQQEQQKKQKQQLKKENEKVVEPIDKPNKKIQNQSRNNQEREPHFYPSRNEFEYEYSIQKNQPNKYQSDSPDDQGSLYESRNYPKMANSKSNTFTDTNTISGNNRSQKNQPLFIEQLVSKNLAGKSISQDKSYYYQQQEFLSPSNRGADLSMQIGSPSPDANSQSAITINVLAQQIASLQKQVEQAQQQQSQKNIEKAPAKDVNTNIQTNPREVEALLDFVPPEEQKKLLMHLLLNKQLPQQNQPRDEAEAILSNWKPVVQQAEIPQKSQQKLQTLQQVQPVSQVLSHSRSNQIPKQALRDQREFTPPKMTQPLQRTQSSNRLNAQEIQRGGGGHAHGKSTVEIEQAKRKQEEQLMDDLIRKQEITIKNLQMERSLNKITKSSPKRTLKADSSKNSFSPPKYMQQFNPEHQQQQQSLQHQQMKYQQLQLSPPIDQPVPAKKQRTKWGEQQQQPSQQRQQLQQHQQSQADEDFETVPAKKISDISRQEKENEIEMEEIKRRLKQDFNNYLSQSKLNTLPGRQSQQRVPKENSPSKSFNYHTPTGQEHEYKQAQSIQQQVKQPQIHTKWEIPIEKKSISPIPQSRTPSPYRDARNKKASPIKYEVSFQDSVQQSSGNVSLAEMFQARRGDLAYKKQKESDQRKRDRSAEELKRARSIPKSKEELAMLRKDLMQQTRVSNSNTLSSQEYANIRQNPSKASVYDEFDSEQSFYPKQQQKNNNQKTIKDPPPELLNRLIHGIQAKIDKKDYQKLTMKNYEQLPEIKRKKEEEKKKTEQLERIRVKKEYEQVINCINFASFFGAFNFKSINQLRKQIIDFIEIYFTIFEHFCFFSNPPLGFSTTIYQKLRTKMRTATTPTRNRTNSAMSPRYGYNQFDDFSYN